MKKYDGLECFVILLYIYLPSNPFVKIPRPLGLKTTNQLEYKQDDCKKIKSVAFSSCLEFDHGQISTDRWMDDP